MRDATIQISPYHSVRGTLMTMAMMLKAPPPGKARVLLNGVVYEGTLLRTITNTTSA